MIADAVRKDRTIGEVVTDIAEAWYDSLWHSIAAALQPASTAWPPTLMHYTTLPTFQKIIESNSIVLFNPLTMNDHQEVLAGLRTILRALSDDSAIGDSLRQIDGSLPGFGDQFRKHFLEVASGDAIGTYIFCLSEPDPAQRQGLLSMWRAYGADGNGVCLSINTGPIQKVYAQLRMPVVLYKVRYETPDQLVDKVRAIMLSVASIAGRIATLWQAFPKQVLWGLYQILAIAAVTHKHPGFVEEREWRVINLQSYGQAGFTKGVFPWRDSLRVGLGFNLADYARDINTTLDQLFGQVILGPGPKQSLAADAVLHLLTKAQFSNPAKRISFCQTPYRQNK